MPLKHWPKIFKMETTCAKPAPGNLMQKATLQDSRTSERPDQYGPRPWSLDWYQAAMESWEKLVWLCRKNGPASLTGSNWTKHGRRLKLSWTLSTSIKRGFWIIHTRIFVIPCRGAKVWAFFFYSWRCHTGHLRIAYWLVLDQFFSLWIESFTETRNSASVASTSRHDHVETVTLTQEHKEIEQNDSSVLLDTSTNGAPDKDDSDELDKDRATLDLEKDVEERATKKDDASTVVESEDEGTDDTEDGSFLVRYILLVALLLPFSWYELWPRPAETHFFHAFCAYSRRHSRNRIERHLPTLFSKSKTKFFCQAGITLRTCYSPPVSRRNNMGNNLVHRWRMCSTHMWAHLPNLF